MRLCGCQKQYAGEEDCDTGAIHSIGHFILGELSRQEKSICKLLKPAGDYLDDLRRMPIVKMIPSINQFIG